MNTHWAVWAGFGLFVLGMLALDLGVFHRRARAVRMTEALWWVAAWVGLAILFNLGVWRWLGRDKALEFLAGYVVEISLSIDNLFVFILIFESFKVPTRNQHKALFWGILGALVMRAIFIAAGVTLMHRFHWIIYVFGVVLIGSGIKMGLEKDREVQPEKNPVLKLFRRLMPVTSGFVEDSFFVRTKGRLMATPLFVVVLLLESTDVVFAVDSVPAVLAITTDPFIVYTSNVFAILGLRSMFFALAGLVTMFRYLHYGLSAILVFVGAKMMLGAWITIPTLISLIVIAGLLIVSVIASVLHAAPEKKG